MKLASLRDGRDGRLIVVSRDGSRYIDAAGVAPNLKTALENWTSAEPKLREISKLLENGELTAFMLDPRLLDAPLPRAAEWVDGSAYLNHVLLVRKARGAEPPKTLFTDPLVYQGGSSVLLGPFDDIQVADLAWGADFESEVCVVLDDVVEGTKASDAGAHVKLLMLANDVTLRNLIPDELAKGFGFFQGKPATAFAPFAVTPDELGDAWKDGRVHLPLVTRLNGELAGDPNAGPEMHFSFFDLVQHIAKTRSFSAGTILGSGTVSNEDAARGVSCLAERRTRETLDSGAPKTPFMKYDDVVEIEMIDAHGHNLFGTLRQKVVPFSAATPRFPKAVQR